MSKVDFAKAVYFPKASRWERFLARWFGERVTTTDGPVVVRAFHFRGKVYIEEIEVLDDGA